MKTPYAKYYDPVVDLRCLHMLAHVCHLLPAVAGRLHAAVCCVFLFETRVGEELILRMVAGWQYIMLRHGHATNNST